MINSFTPRVRTAVMFTALTSFSLMASAQVEEDSSVSFSEANAQMEAALGLPSAESSITTGADGTVGARVGLESMKMLVVRQNEDGSYSYGHAGSESEATEFMESTSTPHQEEK